MRSATAILEAVTSSDARPQKPRWSQVAAALIHDGILLFDRRRDLPGLSKESAESSLKALSRSISGHQELLALWKKEHEQWEADRQEWEAAYAEYMVLRHTRCRRSRNSTARPPNAAIAGTGGSGSCGRNPSWRRGGKPAVVNDIPKSAADRVSLARPNKRNKIEAEEFFKVNPELQELDKQHGDYQRRFVRPWAKRRHPDGFKHPPTFTGPSADKHPFWFQFKKGETYKDLDFQTCSISLQLLADGADPADDAAARSLAKLFHWRSFCFRADPRLHLVRKAGHEQSASDGGADAAAGAAAGEEAAGGKGRYSCLFADPRLGIDRPAEIRGAKLIFRPARANGDVYLYFTLDVPDLPSRLRITQKSCDKASSDQDRAKCLGGIRDGLGGRDPVTCAVDLGIRHLAAATVRRDGKIVAARIIREDDHPARGPKLPAIGDHKRALARGRRKRGKPVRGEESFVELQTHVNRMGQDRFKKGARRIVAFAREHACDVIVVENLSGLIPDAERERGINKALVNWNRGNLLKWLKQLASDAGMRVVEVAPHHTSQLCSRCGAMGVRFSAAGGQPVFDTVGKLFACPSCNYAANANHNASVNLHRKFYGELAAVRRLRRGGLPGYAAGWNACQRLYRRSPQGRQTLRSRHLPRTGHAVLRPESIRPP